MNQCPIRLITLVASGLLRCLEGKNDAVAPSGALSVEQESKYLWPITLWTLPFTGAEGLEPASLSEQLAKIGQEAFDDFVRNTLPKELTNAKFRQEFEESDASRMNMAFLRWQKQVFSQQFRVPVDELFWNGGDMRMVRNVSYKWDAFYKSPLYSTLRKRIEQVVSAFVTFVEGQKPQRMRTFIWAEVYRYRDFHRPRVHTGSFCTGMLWAKFQRSKAGGAVLMIEDARGVNPPYGKTHSVYPYEGSMNVFPSWTSIFVSPNMVNTTNVVFSFISQPQGGGPEFDWEDDPTGSYIYTKKTRINVKKPKEEPKKKKEEL